jgi:hypothetical protein
MEDISDKLNDYMFIGLRNVDCIDSFGYDLGSSDIIIYKTDILTCIKKLNKQ